MKMNNRIKGAIISCLIAVTLLFIFYGKILQSPNRYFFGNDNDGLQSYYTAVYHIRYDSSISLFSGMNYPYREQLLYTNCQPVVAMAMKFISSCFYDISAYVPAVFNLMMLFSLVIAVLFLYLIFLELKTSVLYAVVASVAIAFLSPQILRFGGHYSLSYVFFIPAIIYFILVFDRRPGFRKSIVAALFILLMSLFHAYYFALAASLLLFYWLIKIINSYKLRKLHIPLIHIAIQLIIPYLLIAAWGYFTSPATDRTSFPSGFLTYTSAWEGVFMRNWSDFYNYTQSFFHSGQTNWEGWAYCGKVATVFCFIIFHLFSGVIFFPSDMIHMTAFIIAVFLGTIVFIFIKKRKKPFRLLDHEVLNILLWASFFSLLFSYAWPFVFFPKLADYIGQLRQFRAVGRFSWIFFWMANIAAFYLLYHFKSNKYLKYSLWVVAFSLIYFDAYQNNWYQQRYLTNRIISLEDQNNQSRENAWIKHIKTSEYQAMIPLPYFHIGSENLNIQPAPAVVRAAIVASWKTGLPMTACLLSRTSISRSLGNVEMYLEPGKKPGIIKNFPSRKPFLIMLYKNRKLTGSADMLIEFSTKIFSTDSLDFYRLEFDSLEKIYNSINGRILKEMTAKKLIKSGNLLMTDTVMNFIFRDQKMGNIDSFPLAFPQKKVKLPICIFDGDLPNYIPGKICLFSFWMSGISKDLTARSELTLEYKSSGGFVYAMEIRQISTVVRMKYDDMALVEMPFKLEKKDDRIRITLRNVEMKNAEFVIENLLIRPCDKDIYRAGKSYLFKNNRFYKITVSY